MATWDPPDGDMVRLQAFNRAVNGIVLGIAKVRDVVSTATTSAAKNTFFRESAAAKLATKGLGRWEPFPYTEITYEQVDKWVEKYGHETRISLEDILMHTIPVHERAAIMLAHGVNFKIEAEIWSQLAFGGAAATASPTHGIRTLAVAANYEWDAGSNGSTSRRPFEDILLAVDQIVSNDNQQYEPDFGLISPYDMARLQANDTIMGNLARMGNSSMDVKGRLNLVNGMELIRSNTVTDDYALVGQKKVCATWVSPQGIQTVYKDDPGLGRVYRSFEFGVLQVTDPASLALISNTQK
jgi:hypothetical protein